ncbi:MAG TPA: trypsin-like peptidase domain-containing protein [Bdellovibrionota bacterium]|nr:trypsin-like peptidase domain-containing protein [Bdellovibrionota bacterium]
MDLTAGANLVSDRADVIYGDDNRKDLSQVSDPFWLERADATVALIKADNITDMGGGRSHIDASSFADSNMLCSSEPFRDQAAAAFCSGFLVAPDTMITAGHCISDQGDCDATRLVFGFSLRNPGAVATNVATSDIYSCASIVHSQSIGDGADFAVIKLTRAVTGHQPLTLRREGALAVGDGLTVIGHPAGLPTKIAGGANVRALMNGFVRANLDTYGGNSGSAVFNSQTGEVEGVLVRGEQDFEYKDGCYISKRCASDACRGEDVTKIAEALPYVDGTAPTGPAPTTTPTPLPSSTPSTTAVFASANAAVAIPDANPAGVLSVIAAADAPRGRRVLVTVDVRHTYRGDLEISVITPGGREILLKEQSFFDGADNVQGTYGLDLTSAQSLAPLSEVNLPGPWMLKVVDRMSADTGTLVGWKLTFQGQI